MNPIYTTPISADLEPLNSAASAYTSGDCLGTPMEIVVPGYFKSGNQGPIMFLQSLTLTDCEDKKNVVEVHFFDAAPGCTDNAPFHPSQAELTHWIGIVKVAATDWTEEVSGTSCVAMKADLVVAAKVPSKSIWAQIVLKSAPTYTNTDAIRGKVAGTVS